MGESLRRDKGRIFAGPNWNVARLSLWENIKQQEIKKLGDVAWLRGEVRNLISGVVGEYMRILYIG